MSKIYSDKVVSQLQNFVNNNNTMEPFIFSDYINIYVDIINVKYINGSIVKILPEDLSKSYSSTFNNSVIKKFFRDIKNNNTDNKYFIVFDNNNYYLLRLVDKSEFKELTKLNAIDIKIVDNYYSIITVSKSNKFNMGCDIVKGTEIKNIVPENNDTDDIIAETKDDILISNSLFDDEL